MAREECHNGVREYEQRQPSHFALQVHVGAETWRTHMLQEHNREPELLCAIYDYRGA